MLEDEDITAALEFAARLSDHPSPDMVFLVDAQLPPAMALERGLLSMIDAIERGEVLIELA